MLVSFLTNAISLSISYHLSPTSLLLSQVVLIWQISNYVYFIVPSVIRVLQIEPLQQSATSYRYLTITEQYF